MLRGISVDEFIGTRGFFAALGMNCVECHTAENADSWAKFADDTPRKQTARKMVLMTRAESGLLVRQVRYSKTLAGMNPTHIEYSDYRPVAGIKMPFRHIVTWTDGQSTTQLSEVQPNVAIDTASSPNPRPPGRPNLLPNNFLDRSVGRMLPS